MRHSLFAPGAGNVRPPTPRAGVVDGVYTPGEVPFPGLPAAACHPNALGQDLYRQALDEALLTLP